MRAVFVALTLFAGPPGGAVAVEWRGPEAPDERLRVAVREAVAEVDGRPLATVQDRTRSRARVAVAHEQPASIRELGAGIRAGLDQADAAYREGRLDLASEAIAALLAEIEAHPELPGAAASAREAQLLAARVAWARADTAAAERALAAALELDPEARLAARHAPPELIARYEALQAALLARHAQDWVTPTLQLGDDASLGVTAEPTAEPVNVEIDGVWGLRPVPPGPHFVVVYRPGHAPVASYRDLQTTWTVPASPQRIASDPDRDHEAVCEALALELLILVERRGSELGLQGYRCGVGYGPVWSGKRGGLEAGAALVVAGPFDASAPGLAGAWSPVILDDPDGLDGLEGPEGSDRPGPKPWVRRGWIWGTSAGVAVAVAGAVVAGVLLGGRKPAPSLSVDANDFIGGF